MQQKNLEFSFQEFVIPEFVFPDFELPEIAFTVLSFNIYFQDLDTSMNVELEDGMHEDRYQDRLAQKAELRSQILSLLDDLDKAIPENI